MMMIYYDAFRDYISAAALIYDGACIYFHILLSHESGFIRLTLYAHAFRLRLRRYIR